MINAPTMEAIPNSLPFKGMRFPKKMINANATAGIIGIMNAFSKNHPDDNTTFAVSAATTLIGSALHS
jgi:hypothetical protein